MRIIERVVRRLGVGGGAGAKPAPARTAAGFVLVKYTDEQGNFDYQRYVAVQTAGNKRKIEHVWADEPTVGYICEFLRRGGAVLKRGLCHGSRNGAEVRWFAEKLGVEVIGTDISDTAEQFGLVQWDFHETKAEWVGAFDFVYTNSHDHAYDPKRAFDAWVGQLAPGGRLIIEHTVAHTASGVDELDPFGVEPELLPYVVLQFAGGRYAVTHLLQPEHLKKGDFKVWIFVIERVGGEAGCGV